LVVMAASGTRALPCAMKAGWKRRHSRSIATAVSGLKSSQRSGVLWICHE
jgi:hypothetical protein